VRIEETIRQWYEIAAGHPVSNANAFFRFMAVWMAFNALYASRHSYCSGDNKQVQAFASEHEAIEEHLRLLEVDPTYLRKVLDLSEEPIGGLLGKVQILDVRKLPQVCEALYQVRCNLFHGGKQLSNERDEMLVEASCYIVSRLIEPYL